MGGESLGINEREDDRQERKKEKKKEKLGWVGEDCFVSPASLDYRRWSGRSEGEKPVMSVVCV